MSEFSGCISKYFTITVEAQKYLVSKGLRITAEILPANPMLKPVCEMLSKESGMETIYFIDKFGAENWLSLIQND